jgi:hypothetical protein
MFVEAQFTPEEVLAIRTKMLTVDSFGGVENIAILMSFVETYREQQAALLAASEAAGTTGVPERKASSNAFVAATQENIEAETITPETNELLDKAIAVRDGEQA